MDVVKAKASARNSVLLFVASSYAGTVPTNWSRVENLLMAELTRLRTAKPHNALRRLFSLQRFKA